ncbi:MAG: nucleotidyltransferase domain-containing protein [Verrucomicrobiota bacterium]|nr:nucleotidyltransferase domain-containing protein [Verrucomicrobiota bacterium]
MNKTQQKLDLEALELFFLDRKDIASSFLFGSSQNGFIEPGSDVDIAVLFENPNFSVEDKFNLYSELCTVVEITDKVDMIVLNKADIILAFEAISGKILSQNNPEKTADFASYTSRVYEDIMANIDYQYSLRKL